MERFLYNTAMRLAAPAGAAWLAASARQRPLLKRFAPPIPEGLERPIWVQACSVGEVGVAQAVIKGIRSRWPERSILATASTRTGYELAESRLANTALTWFPFDHPRTVRQFFDAAKPGVLILIETELWPTVIEEARRRDVPVVVLNGRLSEKHYPRYKRMKRLGRAMFASLDAVAVQNAEYAARFAALGTPRDRIEVAGNVKFDGVSQVADENQLAVIRKAWPAKSDGPLIVFGSTRPGDEALAAKCWQSLKAEWPNLRLAVAPRHVERSAEAAACFDSPAFRSALPEGAERPILIVDTVGELAAFYAMADIAVVGGSFYPGVNGHNPLEPAALGTPTVFGPYMSNFSDAAETLRSAGGAMQVDGPEALPGVLQGLLRDAGKCAELAENGRRAIAAQRGALERNLDVLAPFIAKLA